MAAPRPPHRDRGRHGGAGAGAGPARARRRRGGAAAVRTRRAARRAGGVARRSPPRSAAPGRSRRRRRRWRRRCRGMCWRIRTHVRALAADLASRVGAPGWCGRRRDGTLVLEAGGNRPRVAADAQRTAVTLGGAHLLGSPLLTALQARVEGMAAAHDGVLEGWAWHPADAGRDPVLRIVDRRGRTLRRIVATDQDMPTPRPLARPRRFVVAGIAEPVRVLGADGRDLAGSPLDPGQEARAAAAAALAVARALPLAGRARKVPFLPTPAAMAGPPARVPKQPRRRVAVVVPAYRDATMTLACLDAVFATVPAGTRVIVVDDATPEPELAAALDGLAASAADHAVAAPAQPRLSACRQCRPARGGGAAGRAGRGAAQQRHAAGAGLARCAAPRRPRERRHRHRRAAVQRRHHPDLSRSAAAGAAARRFSIARGAGAVGAWRYRSRYPDRGRVLHVCPPRMPRRDRPAAHRRLCPGLRRRKRFLPSARGISAGGT